MSCRRSICTLLGIQNNFLHTRTKRLNQAHGMTTNGRKLSNRTDKNMISLFNNLSTRIKGTVKFPEWDYIRDGLTMNLDHTNKYYRSGAYAIGSDHELIKLLFGLGTSVAMDLFDYYKRVDSKALTVAQQLGFTTSMSKGRIFSNVFFSGKSKEVIIVTDEPFDPVKVSANWRDVRPIKILRHGFDKIDCFPLTGKLESNGISVFAINLPMLAVQYHAYRKWQDEYVAGDSGRNSIYHFCYAYPLNNMIFEAMDHAIFNRMIRIRNGIETSDNTINHPFHVTNFTLRCDRLLMKINESLDSMERDIGNITLTIPLIDKQTVFDLLKLPDVSESRQINWAIYLARIDMLLFLFSFEGVTKQNQSEINKFKYELRLYLKDGTIQSAVPKELFLKQKAVIEQLVEQM